MYCTLRTEKIKDRTQATNAIEHNLRLRFQSNIDKSRSSSNKCLFDTFKVDPTDPSSFQKKLSKKYEDLKVKEKSNNVFAMEFVISASPEFFFGHIDGFSQEYWDSLSMENAEDRKVIKSFWEQIDKDKLREWQEVQKQFCIDEFGENLERIDIHLDEKTPHVHVLLNTLHKSVKKYKNQKGEFFKETYSLSAEKYNPEYLTALHDRHALKNSIFGLKRGRPGSKEKHKKLKDYYEENAVKTIELIEKAEKFDRVETIFPVVKQALKDSYFRMMQLLGILEKRENELTKEENDLIASIAKTVPDLSKKKTPKNQ